MKRTKKLLSAMLAVLLLTAMAPIASFAEPDDASAALTTQTEKEMLSAHATIKEITDNFVLVKTDTDGDIKLNTSDQTVFLDNKTREIKSLSDLKEGDQVIAYYSPKMTRSEPPQSVCYAIITNLGDLSLANLLRVGEISDTDGGIKFLDADGGYIITVLEDTPITAIDTVDAKTTADICEGDLLFAWFGIVALSYPAQAQADAILIVGSIDEETGTEEDAVVSDSPFADVKEKDWFYDAVMYVFENELMTGTSTDPMLFTPGGTMTRGMVVTVLYRMAGSTDVSDIENPFDDVADGRFYTDAVKWAAENEIMNGVSDSDFAPDAVVTREQMATILTRYATSIDKGPVGAWAIHLTYTDLDKVSDWAGEGVMFCTLKGVITGKPGDLFDPKGPTTRAEFATMLQRFIGSVVEEPVTEE